MKVTNKTNSPQVVYSNEGRQVIPVGGFYEGEFSDGESAGIVRNTAVFDTDAAPAAHAGGPKIDPTSTTDRAMLDELTEFKSGLGGIAGRLKIYDSDLFASTVEDHLDHGDKARKILAEIVALFGTDDVDELNVKSAVGRLLQDAKERPTIDTSTGASDLASAVALLDDANDDHWTQAGLPDISTLKTLTGGEVTRAMVDQLPAEQKRERAK